MESLLKNLVEELEKNLVEKLKVVEKQKEASAEQ